MDPTLVQLFANLTEISLRSSAAAITTKVAAIKTRKQTLETANELSEIINQLVADRDEAIGIAQGLKESLVSQQISAKDIRHIVRTVLPVFRTLAEAAESQDEDESMSTIEMIDILKSILTPNTLTILQTLGFNYQAAIGEPLTLLVRRMILSNLEPVNVTPQELQLAQTQQAAELLKLAQDPEAVERLRQVQT